MFYDLKVEMVDIVRPYEWNFAICAMRVDEKNETRKISMFQRMIERYSYLFLMDAWEPQLLVPEEYIHKTEKTDIEREAEDVFHQLSPEEQKMLLRQMKGLLAVPA